MNENLFFKKRTVRVKEDTSMLVVMAILNQAGVMIDGRYELTRLSDGTKIVFLATDTQWYIIKMLLDNKGEIEDGAEDVFKNILRKLGA